MLPSVLQENAHRVFTGIECALLLAYPFISIVDALMRLTVVSD